MPAGATYDCIATTTLSSAQSSVTFSSISGSYTDLVLIVNAKMSANNEDALKLEFNSDTGTNYSETNAYTDVTTPGSSRGTNRSVIPFYNQSTTEWVVTRINIQNYANTTTYKTVLGRNDNAGKSVFATVGLWRSTSAITTIKISPAFAAGSNWVSGSTFTLYGITAA